VTQLVESSAVRSQFRSGAAVDSQRELNAVNAVVEGSTALEAVIRQRLAKTQQNEKS
jgi:hypothetical protein